MQLVPGVVSFFSPIWASCNHLVLSCQLLAAAVHQLVLGHTSAHWSFVRHVSFIRCSSLLMSTCCLQHHMNADDLHFNV